MSATNSVGDVYACTSAKQARDVCDAGACVQKMIGR